MKPVYQAYDGEIFEDRNQAVDYENELFDAWLDNLLESEPEPTLSDVVRHFNNSPRLTCEAEEYYGTPWDMLKTSLKTYWEDMGYSRLKHTAHPKESN